MNNKIAFKQFCEQNYVNLFGSFWWWNNVVKDNWDVLIHKKDDQILACMPYHFKYKFGLKAIIPPVLTPYQSISFSIPDDAKSDKQLSFVRKSLEHLINEIPSCTLFLRQVDYKEDYLLPFIWNNYEVKVRYTYILDTTIDKDLLFMNMKDTLRREIKKAKTNTHIVTSNNVDALYLLKQKSANNSNEPLNYSKEYLIRIAGLIELGKGSIQEITENNKTIASLFVCWDNYQLYYICGALDPDYRNSGGLSWLLWEAILQAKNRGLTFNFEGSMIKSIERYFASFGASPTPFFEIKKVNPGIIRPLFNKI